MVRFIVVFLLLLFQTRFAARCSGADIDSARSRAIGYLAREVPRWRPENGCFSCHNNGDAARALLVAGREEVLKATVDWLARPDAWDGQQADAPFRDKRLARVQFSLALLEAIDRGVIPREPALRQAAPPLAALQARDGSWPLEEEAAVGSPATYGTPLATWAAIRVLDQAGGYEEAVARARRFLGGLRSGATVDIAAASMSGAASFAERLRAAQNADGGWGPYRATPSEAFDTAIAMLALSQAPAARDAVRRGAQWLAESQLDNGGWSATTRPAGGVSYAQHISTTGWAALALLSLKP